MLDFVFHEPPAAVLGRALPGPEYLALAPTPAPVAYHALVRWEETVAGATTRSSVARALALHLAPGEDAGWHARFTAALPVLRKDVPTPADDFNRLLHGLYQEIEFDAAPTGALRAVRNLPAIRRAWHADLKPALLRRHPDPTDQLTAAFVAGAERTLHHPTAFGRALCLDYLYAALLGPFYAATYRPGHATEARRRFPGFFAAAELRFTERRTIQPAPVPGLVRLRLLGTPALRPAEYTAIRAEVQARLPPGAAPLDALDALRPHYQADYTLDRATGLPLDVRLVLGCATGEAPDAPAYFSKTYTLTIHQA